MKESHNQAYLLLSRIKRSVGKKPDVQAAVDAIGTLKRAFDLARDIKMELEQTVEKLEQVACAMYMRDNPTGEPIHGDWFTGTPGGKTRPKLPSAKDDPTNYANMLTSLGIDPASAGYGLVRLHYPSIIEYLNNLDEAGKPMPAGVDMNVSKTEFQVRCLQRRDVDIDALCQGE